MGYCQPRLKLFLGFMDLVEVFRLVFGMRNFLLSLITLCAAAPAMAEAPVCDLLSASRGQTVQSYVPRAMACLEAPNPGLWYDDALERDMFDRVNAERVALGLAPLELRIELLAPARIHSFDMGQEGFFAHRGVDGRTAFRRISALDRTLVQTETRENLAALTGFLGETDVASMLHNLLMESEEHRANILAPTLTHMSIGVVRAEKGVWVTQLFVRQDGTLAEPLALTHRADEAIAIEAALSGRRQLDDTFLLSARGQKYSPSATELAPVGDLQLMVVGVRMTEEQVRHTMTLNGPAVSIIR